MVSFYDENRFKKLPKPEEWEKFKEAVRDANGKLIYITKTHWHNALTRCKGVVTDMPIFATHDSSSRPLAILKIEVMEFDKITQNYQIIDTWVFNQDYVHTNITTDISTAMIIDNASETIGVGGDRRYKKRKYRIISHSICNPITMHHFYERTERDLTLLFTGQLQGQNSGSPFRSVNSVANNYDDVALRTINYRNFIKRTAPAIQLLTRRSPEEIRNLLTQGTLINELQNAGVTKIDDEHFYVKYITNDRYILVSKEVMEKEKEENKLSLYYPVIDKEQVDNIMNNIPKVELDMTCIGLGSAGTGILDQVVRGNWFNKFMLIDFDKVEEKNLRNQWYRRGNAGCEKTRASQGIIQNIIPNAEIIIHNNKFQDIDYSHYVMKYIISGFDSIECRLELLNAVEEKKIQAKYLIDTRYDDLSASIFFIDTENAADMEYYKKGLISDKEAFDKILNEKKIESNEQWIDYLKQKGVFESTCGQTMNKICGEIKCPMLDCESADCKELWIKILNEHKAECHSLYRENPPAEENSCVKWNLIDIYKFASSFVFAAIRDIEEGKEKQFTHVEATTDGLPRSMVLRK